MEKTGEKRPWKSQERFPLSHSFNNKLDDRNHLLQNAKTSVASLRRLITPTRNADHDQPGTLITFIGIRNLFAFTFIYSLFIFHETRLFKTPHCTILVQVRLPPVPPNVLANDTAYCPCLNGNPEVERT